MNMEILEDLSVSNDRTIVKGQRTKRLRPSSSTSSTGGEFNYNPSFSSRTASSGISTSAEEDEDMANFLILLARGGFPEEEIKPPEDKFSSRKFMAMATTTDGKVGNYVYECKTCSRAFPSFQALGGHRASHKKPKLTEVVDPPPAPPPPGDEEGGRKFNELNAVTSTQSPNHAEKKHKIHECSICGSEFASGQALGGHMRRHRSAIKKTGDMLAFDLNLPAPPEDDRRGQQPRLVFSAAALVDFPTKLRARVDI